MGRESICTWRGGPAGSCHAWPLPADATCATVARQVFRDAISDVELEQDLADDCVLMASELAANTLHAHAEAGTGAGGGGDRLVSVTTDMGGELIASAGPAPPASAEPELWLYLRGLGTGRELVCKVFDCHPGWQGPAPGPEPSRRGRGLQLVHELSRGRWGHHPTRARLDGRGVRGKAVWFAVPAPLAHVRLADVTGLCEYTLSADVTATRARGRLSARQAATQLQAMLTERGLGGLVQIDRPGGDMSVLSVSRRLTVRCGHGVMSLAAPEGPVQRWDYTDIVEAAEQTVRRYEELEALAAS